MRVFGVVLTRLVSREAVDHHADDMGADSLELLLGSDQAAPAGGAEADDEFRDFMRGRWSAMVRLAYTLTGDQGHAEDIAQAAFASAYAAWGRVRRAGDPDRYVRAIVVHENSKRFRKLRVREDLRAAVPEFGTGRTDRKPSYEKKKKVLLWPS